MIILGSGMVSELKHHYHKLQAPHDTTGLCQIVVTVCQYPHWLLSLYANIHTDAVRALSWIFSMYFLLSAGGSSRLFKKKYIYEDHEISFQTFFVWALLLVVHIWNSRPLRNNLLLLQCTCCTFQQLLEGPKEVLLCERVNDPRHSLFHLLSCLITTASELRE